MVVRIDTDHQAPREPHMANPRKRDSGTSQNKLSEIQRVRADASCGCNCEVAEREVRPNLHPITLH